MNRNQKQVYCFLYDDNKHFYRAAQSSNGSWAITHNAQLYPLNHNPKNLIDSPVEMATNKQYFSMFRSINYPLEFTFDGAAILNSKYVLGKGVNENMYFAMFEFDEADGKYKLSYNGKIDFQQKRRNEKLPTFTVPVLDDSGWGVLSQNDDVEYSIDCSESNPKSVKVLFDNFTLRNRFTYQSVQAPIQQTSGFTTHAIPFVLINQDGDSAGLITKSQVGDLGGDSPDAFPVNAYTLISNNYFLSTFYQLNGVNFIGNFRFTWSNINPAIPSGGLVIYFKTNLGQFHTIFSQPFGGLIVGHEYNIDYNFTIDLSPGEKIFLLANISDATANNFSITPIVTNTFTTTETKAEPAICFGLRPLDLLKSIVQKATLERYTIDSNFFSVNNKTIILSGDSIRGVRDAKIYTSFKDFFESFSALFFMALRVINGSIFMELADEVYKQGSNIIDLGEIIEFETSPAIEYIPNELEVGSPKQDYRHASGRLEFNAPSKFSFPFTNVKNKLSLTGKYRTDCYGMIFLLLDYRGASTQDNSGDKDVFIVDITDDIGSATQDIETFENITVKNAPLAPIIKYPLSGDIINFDKPFLKGIGIPGTDVNIYIADVFDGSTVVDVDGNWSYQIVASLPSYDPGVSDGISIINATNTDMGGALNTIQLIIDTTIAASTGITYPRSFDTIYNNLPLIRGVAPAGTNIDILFDGVALASVVADNSCKFEYKVTVPMLNGVHTLNIGGANTAFSVNSFVAFPLITYIGSELDGFPIVNNLPLIRGVAIPGTTVFLWLNYVADTPLGVTTADANGDWEYQVVPLTYPDSLTGTPVVMAPIRNGLSVLSTLLINNVVKISISGFKLNRPNYDSITGVPDNTVFNTRLSNMHCILNHKSLLSSIMDKQHNDVISYQTHDKNSNLRTVLGTEVITERADISPSSLGSPLMRLEYGKIKVVSKRSFYKTLYDFNNGGTVKGIWKGQDVFFLPIGDMKMKGIMDDIQDWKLIISPLTTYNKLLNLYKNGLTINLMQNAIFHSDANSMQAVEYNYQQPAKYNFKEMYDDWFDNRNSAWLFGKTDYIQPFQQTEVIRDQIITNGVSAMTLRIYRCKDATLVDTLDYNPVVPSPIPLPEIVLEVEIDWSDYPPSQYFCAAFVGETCVYIFERIETRVKWNRTILIESNNSVNTPGVFYSTGFKTILRMEGLVRKIQPDIDSVIAKEESGNRKLVYSNLSKKRGIRFGNPKGIPDYMGIKMAGAIINDNCIIEGQSYTIGEEEKINPSEDIPGVPMYYYEVVMSPQENSRGKVFGGAGPGIDVQGVIVVLDASAIGLPAHSLIMIDEV